MQEMQLKESDKVCIAWSSHTASHTAISSFGDCLNR